MLYNVAQLLKEPTGSVRRYELAENLDDLDPELDILGSAGWQLATYAHKQWCLSHWGVEYSDPRNLQSLCGTNGCAGALRFGRKFSPVDRS